jgi:DNA-binding transcriptional LysR family regulator
MKIFSAIPVFVAVVECGSFSQAGEKLGTSKSAVSKRINQLESQLGVRLMHRTTRRLSLTEAGERYYDYARNALMIASEGEDAITQLQGKPQGTLRINAPMAFGRLHIAPLIPAFLSEYPDIKINMAMDDKVVDMVEGSFDIAIRIGELPDSSLIARRLAPCHSVLCASPEYVAKFGEPKTPTDLINHNCLFYSYFQAGVEWTFEGGVESEVEGAIKVQPQGNYQVNNSEALHEALLAGLGICQMPTFIVGSALASGKLVPLLSEYALPQHSIYAVFSQRKHLPAKVRVFLDFITARFGGEEPYWDVM